MPEINGERFIYIVVQHHAPGGLNGFRVQSVARDVYYNDSPSLSTAIGLAGQMNHPLSIVRLRLQPGGSDIYSVRFGIPCSPPTNSFPLGWFDADRPPTGLPYDTDIYWNLTNNTTGQSLNSGQFSFMNGTNENNYLGGNNDWRQINVQDVNFPGFSMRVRQGDNFTFSWGSVDFNNGVQVMIPFSEVDVGQDCNPTAAAQCVSAGPIGDVFAGQPFEYQVTVQNTGGTTWNSSYRLGSAHHSTNNYLTNGPVGTPEDRVYFGSIVPPPPGSSVPPGAQATFRFTRTAPATPGLYPYEWRIMKEGPPYPPNNGWFGPRCGSNIRVAPPAATATCSIAADSRFGIGERFTVEVTVHNTTAAGGPSVSSADGQLVISSTPGLSSDTPPGIPPPPGRNVPYGPVAAGDASPPIPIENLYSDTPAVYNITAQLQIPSSPPCTRTVYVGNKSYLKTFGGEVMTGGAFGSGVCTPPTGGIDTWAENRSGSYVGASAQLTVTALMQVNEFYSESNRSSANHPKRLTIANTGSGTPSSTYGGGSGVGRCITDYYNDTRQGTAINFTSAGSIVSGSNNQYTRGSDVTLGGLTLGANTQAAIYVDGEVVINGNVAYGASASWETHPYLAIIATGDIKITGNVTQLDGLYVSQGGTIYTCTNGSSLHTAATVFDSCQAPLTINGGLIGNRIRFLRMNGTLRDAAPGEYVGNPNIAEVINYTPEMFLAPSPLRRPNTSSGGTGGNPDATGAYQSIKALPPIY